LNGLWEETPNESGREKESVDGGGGGGGRGGKRGGGGKGGEGRSPDGRRRTCSAYSAG